MFDLPILYKMSKAFWVVFLSDVLPGDVDTPNKLTLGWCAAKIIAKVSSNPGSQSSHTF